MSKQNFSNDFRYLLARLGIGIVASVAVTGIASGLLHLGFWNYWWTLLVGAALGGILFYKRFFEAQRAIFWAGMILTTLPAAAFQYTLFYTEDKAAVFDSLGDYNPTEDHHRFLEIEHWYYSTGDMGAVEVTTERRRRGRVTGTSKRVYVAVPMFVDSTDTQPKVWMALDFDQKKADRIFRSGNDDDLIGFDRICCFERVSPSLADDFRSAIDYCDADSMKCLRDEAIFLMPLYKPFIPRGQWMLYSLYTLAGAIAGMAIVALCVRDPEEDEDEENENEEEESDEREDN